MFIAIFYGISVMRNTTWALFISYLLRQRHVRHWCSVRGYRQGSGLSWLRAVTSGNPLTYEVDALRALMLVDGVSEFGLAVDFLVMVGTTGVLTLVGAWLYPAPGPVTIWCCCCSCVPSRPKEDI